MRRAILSVILSLVASAAWAHPFKVLVQWSTDPPGGWEEIDCTDYATLPTKRLPTGGETIDGLRGWVHAVNVQGVVFSGMDHYAVEDTVEGCRVTTWADDPEDYPPGERFAVSMNFAELHRDDYLGGAWNTNQTRTLYLDDDIATRWPEEGETTRKRWSEFVPPRAAVTKHGVWTTDSQNLDHEQIQQANPKGWREWTEGVPEEELVAGIIPDQRALGRYNHPVGTLTYFASTTALSNAIHSGATEDEFIGTATTQSNSQCTLTGGSSVECFVFTTATGQPNQGDWGNGNYRYQLDATTVGVNVTFGVLTAGSANGHFARINSTDTTDLQTWTQVEGIFSGTGLQLATTGTINPTAGSTGDRWEVVVAATRTASMGNQFLTLQLNEADDFTDGPFDEVAGARSRVINIQ